MTDLVHQTQDTFRKLVGRACEKLFPGIGRYDRVIYAKVTNVSELGGMVTEVMKLWSCDLQPLKLDLTTDQSRAVLKDVPIDPVQISQMGAALFPKPFVGMIVRMGWMGGHRAYPFIHSFTAEGQTVPLAIFGELTDLLYQAITLLENPRVTAVGPGPYDPATLLLIEALKLRIPR
jgi:hypothetical protein